MLNAMPERNLCRQTLQLPLLICLCAVHATSAVYMVF